MNRASFFSFPAVSYIGILGLLSVKEQSIFHLMFSFSVFSRTPPDVFVAAAVYLRRFLKYATVSADNWAAVTFTAVRLAEKVLNDHSLSNKNLAEAFPVYSASTIFALESEFLSLIDWDVEMTAAEYNAAAQEIFNLGSQLVA
eukprot:GABV01002223.1.p1 GENE.GABV01002223.1~~GABV01002223.1.p1  ORF type:complete len:143 (-),score=43.38 GABV01002223.1:105-533(-)